MTEQKKEIRISKNKLFKNLKLWMLSILISFLILFVLSLFGDLDFQQNFYNNSNHMAYSGILGEYEGAGNVSHWNNGEYYIYDNIFYDGVNVENITFFHKFILFYVPLILYKNFLVFAILTAIIYFLIKMKNKLKNKYSVKFE
jgi:hypothetical protein